MNSYWIWNYGDYEIFHSNSVNSRREQYKMEYPPFWKLYPVDSNVVFYAEKEIPHNGKMILHLNGMGYIKINGAMYGNNREIEISKGSYSFSIHICNLTGLPAAYIESDVLATNGDWYTLDEEQKKISVGFEKCYSSPTDNPEKFPFLYKEMLPASKEILPKGVLCDFGKELFGYLYIDGAAPEQQLHISYGESREEALDTEFSVVQEDICGKSSYKLRQRAFRYIYIIGASELEIRGELEYKPLVNKAEFRCDNDSVNKIWDMCAYTLQLNMREVLTEAVKRDRWLWGGDAYQAFKFIKYLCSDSDIVRRSLIGLRGKEPFCEHINTITDYSLFWVIGLLEYYECYGDIDFIRAIYKRAESLMAFCAGRENEEGFIIGKYGDWIFIDWSDTEKTGAVAAEQMLYIAANRAMGVLSDKLNKPSEAYFKKAELLTEKVNRFFWNEEKGAFIDSYTSGKNQVTRHANIFAVMYEIANPAQQQSIIENALRNEAITKITTPYFEGYELDVMGKIGDIDYIYDMIASYWQGMLELGATTVWEEYNPELSGVEHYAMYGDKYQKSLCHAWGASPIYLLGKYFLGVTGTAPGYERFEVKPQLGKFKYIDGSVPVRDGMVKIYLSDKRLSVVSSVSGGSLIFSGKTYELMPNKAIELEF